MLNRLHIRNIALIDRLEVEFGSGLNLLTGETGSGKSIIVDSLGALTGDRVYSELIKEGETTGQIEGLFTVSSTPALAEALGDSGIEFENGPEVEIIVRRDLSLTGKNRIFINDQMVTNALLKRIGPYLVDIHGQGEQASLYDVSTHIGILDRYAGNSELRKNVGDAFAAWSAVRRELDELERDDAEKLQLVDILKFQIDEIRKAGLAPGEDVELEEEKRRVNNAEKLSSLSDDAFSLIYDNAESTLATLDRASRKIDELAEYDSAFREFEEGLGSARAVLEEAALAARNFRDHLEFSPERLDEIENRLAEITRLKRKYGDTIEAVTNHLSECEQRLESIETSELRAKELRDRLVTTSEQYVKAARALHDARETAARRFEAGVITDLRDVALEKARFEVRIESPPDGELESGKFRTFTANGFDLAEFYFSANPGESLKPIAKVASGGEASRLMLILKTAARSADGGKAAVFDEIDTGIGGRVAEAVGRKLKELAASQQVMCVTHQPQIASLAERHYLVEKTVTGERTSVRIRELDAAGRVDEIARMLAGETITDAARKNAKAMLAAKK